MPYNKKNKLPGPLFRLKCGPGSLFFSYKSKKTALYIPIP